MRQVIVGDPNCPIMKHHPSLKCATRSLTGNCEGFADGGIRPGTFFIGDNLEGLIATPDNIIDFIYLDPPFNSDKVYYSKGDDTNKKYINKSFVDTFKETPELLKIFENLKKYTYYNDLVNVINSAKVAGGPEDDSFYYYSISMARRLIEMRRVLKPTGTIMYHCNGTASHVIRMLMDVIFGGDKFINEIVWYHPKIAKGTKKFSRSTDTILFYSKEKDFKFNSQYHLNLKNELFNRFKRHLVDEVLYYGKVKGKNDSSLKPIKRKLERMLGRKLRDDDVLIDFRLLENHKRRDNVIITDSPRGKSEEKESDGQRYPTQKPELLLEVLINSATDQGDIVLDPFCGSGTTCAVAAKLNRNWIGFDFNVKAILIAQERLSKIVDVDFEEDRNPEVFIGDNDREKTLKQAKFVKITDTLPRHENTSDVFGGLVEVETKDKLKQNAHLRQGMRCLGCGILAVQYKTFELDQIKPAGGYTKENTQVLCHKCNNWKSDNNDKPMIKLWENVRDRKTTSDNTQKDWGHGFWSIVEKVVSDNLIVYGNRTLGFAKSELERL